MILVFDTSTSHIAVGLANESGDILQEFHGTATPEERGIHDARLARETDRMLKAVDLPASQIKRIGLIIGPGSFTGLRIGLAFAKGLSFATDAAIVAITQHEALLRSGTLRDPRFHYQQIITAAYRPGLYYVADEKASRAIQTLTASELEVHLSAATLAHEDCDQLQDLASVTLCPITLEAISQITLESTPVTSDALVELEPLYLTDFKTNA